MSTLATAAGVSVVVGIVAAFLWWVHILIRPPISLARLPSALRDLEPRGGRHRFPVRAFEQLTLGTVSLSFVFLLLALFPVRETGAQVAAFAVFCCFLVTIWWGWRRGTLRAFEAELRDTTEENASHNLGGPPRHG